VGENVHWLYIRQRNDSLNIQGAQKPKLPKKKRCSDEELKKEI
jgi:hypothetical protein